MGAGGIHIIRNRIKQAADSPAIREQLSPTRQSHYDAIMAKDVADWLNEDAHFLLRCIGNAHEAYE